MTPKVLMDGNWVKVERAAVAFTKDTVVVLTFKGQPGLTVTLSEDEWRDVRQATHIDEW